MCWWTRLVLLLCVAERIIVHCDVIVHNDLGEVVDQMADLPAKFGPNFPVEGLRVYAVKANPDPFGCRDIDKPPDDLEYPFVVLMSRNNCNFTEKVRYAQLAGYKAAIVYNVNSDDLLEMSGDRNDDIITIPSMFVGQSAAKIIIESYSFDSNCSLVLNRDLPFNINTHLILPFIAVVGFCFLIMIGFIVAKCIRDRRRQRRHRLPRQDLKRIPVIKFHTGHPFDTCAICLDDFIEGEKLRLLPCKHAYHTKCIDPWLTKNKRNCPMCKKKIHRSRSRFRSRASSSGSSSSSSSNDDRRPLINPVRNNPNSGTFSRPQQRPQPRPNPFDRPANQQSAPQEEQRPNSRLRGIIQRMIRRIGIEGNRDDDDLLQGIAPVRRAQSDPSIASNSSTDSSVSGGLNPQIAPNYSISNEGDSPHPINLGSRGPRSAPEDLPQRSPRRIGVAALSSEDVQVNISPNSDAGGERRGRGTSNNDYIV